MLAATTGTHLSPEGKKGGAPSTAGAPPCSFLLEPSLGHEYQRCLPSRNRQERLTDVSITGPREPSLHGFQVSRRYGPSSVSLLAGLQRAERADCWKWQ